MRVRGHLGERQDRCHAGVGSLEYGHPFVAVATGEHFGESLAQHRPTSQVQLLGQGLPGEPEAFQQGRVELGLQRSDGDVAAVGADVCVVERRARIEQVATPLIAP